MKDKGRRRSVRTPRRYKVRTEQLLGFTVDVGAGGFCIQSSRVLPPGTEVEGTFEVDGMPVPFTGSVAWAQAGNCRLGVMGRMGIRFTAGSTNARAPSVVAKPQGRTG